MSSSRFSVFTFDEGSHLLGVATAESLFEAITVARTLLLSHPRRGCNDVFIVDFEAGDVLRGPWVMSPGAAA